MLRRLAPLALALAPACDDDEFLPVVRDDDPTVGPALAAARLFLDHDAITGSAGVRVQADGTPWERLTVGGPVGRVLELDVRNELRSLGLTHLDVASRRADLELVLDRFPEGDYPFEGRSARDDLVLPRTATLTHAVPAVPEILTPAEGAVVDDDDVRIRWQAVTTDLDGAPLELVGYRVVVAEAGVPIRPDADWYPMLTVHLPAGATSLEVPEGFLRPGTAYRVEVVAIEASGNQTRTEGSFRTE